MARVKSSVASRKRRKRTLKKAKGYFGSKRTLYRTANEQVMRSLRYSFIGRKQTKRNFRKLWIQRINAACRLNGTKYSQFIYGLNLADVEVNRKMLADMAVNDEMGFKTLVGISNEAIKTYPNGKKDKLNGKVETTQPKVKKEKPVVEAKKTKPEEKPVVEPEKVEIKKEPVAKAEKTEVKEDSVDLNSLTVAELKEMAKEKNLTNYSKLRKAELIEAIKEVL